MRLYVKNILGIEEVDLTPEAKHFIVEAPNAAGKTSLATAVAAAVSGQYNPLKFSAAFKKNYAHDDDLQENCQCEVSDGPNVYSWSLLDGCEWEGPTVHPAVVSLVDWITLPPKDSKKLMEELLLPAEGEMYEAVQTALKKVLSPKAASGIVARLKGEGHWEKTLELYEGQRSAAAAAWRAVTGETFGSKKAEKWRPKDWSVELEGVTADEAHQAAHDRELAVVDLLARKGACKNAEEASEDMVAEAEEGYKDLSNAVDAAAAALGEFRQECKPVWDKRQKLQQEITKINSIGESRPKPRKIKDTLKVTCPKCKVAYYLISGELVSIKEADARVAKEMEEWQAWFEESTAPLPGLLEQSGRINDEWAKLEEKGNNMKRSLDELEAKKKAALGTWNALKKKAGATQGAEWTEEAESMLMQAQMSLKEAAAEEAAVRTQWDAHKHYSEWLQYNAIVKVLGPDGVRANYVGDAIGNFNKQLAEFCQPHYGRKMEISASGDVLYAPKGGSLRPAKLASKSEQWLTNSFLTLAAALHTKSWIAILDGADILDEAGFDHMERVVKGHLGDVAVMVCLTGWDVQEMSINAL